MHYWTETPVARKPHRCDHCGRDIPPGCKYLRQRVIDGGDTWVFRSHEDCHELAVELMDGDFLDGVSPLHEYCSNEIAEWRGFYPHVVCRFDLSRQLRNGEDRP